MRTCLLLGLAALLTTGLYGQGCGTISTGVVINELSYDDSGTDDREFVELYNGGSSAVDISLWVLDATNENFPTDGLTDYIIPMGTMLAAGDYYVVGAASVPNVDLAVSNPLSTAGMGTNLWDNGNGAGNALSIILRDAVGTVQDSVTYESNKVGGAQNAAMYPAAAAGLTEGEGIWGNFASINTGTFLICQESWSRWEDGLDTDDNGTDFGLFQATPGEDNQTMVTNALPFVGLWDALPNETSIPGFCFSFVEPFAVDPTIAGSQNFTALPVASPVSGGNALIMWDNAGGGNSSHLITPAQQDWVVDCYVWFETAAFTGTCVPDEHESWSIGVRGHTGTFYNDFDPTNLNNANGNTGISWSYRRDINGQAALYLVDNGDGSNKQILGTIPLIAGMNDGWQRLQLTVVGDVIDARFGGGLGTAPETCFQCLTNTIQCGTFYLGYREFICVNAEGRPPTIDDLIIFNPSQQPFMNKLDQPLGAGSIRLANRGLGIGINTINVLSFELCGTPGTFQLAPLPICASPAGLPALISQVTDTTGIFAFTPTATSRDIGPFPGAVPPGLAIEYCAFEFNGVSFGRISCLGSIVTQ